MIFQAAGGAGNGVFAEAKAENQKLAANADKRSGHRCRSYQN